MRVYGEKSGRVLQVRRSGKIRISLFVTYGYTDRRGGAGELTKILP